MRNLVKTSNLSVSKVRQFSHSKPSYSKTTLATCKFKQMKASARFKKENWCMDLAYVDILVKKKNGVNYLLVHQDLFDRTLDAKELKAKDSKETVRKFLTIITKKKRPKKFGSTKEQNLLESSKDLRSWRNGSLLFNESHQGCICWTHKTVLENFSLPLQWRLWIQVLSRFVSIRHNPDFQKNLLDRLDIKENQEFRLFVHSVQQASTKIWKTQVRKWRQSFYLEVWLNLQ